MVSIAVYVTDSAVASLTENEACPVESVVAVAGVITELPPDGLNFTTLPVTGSPLASDRSTKIVALVFPSAGTLAALGNTTESAIAAGGGGGVPKVTDTCAAI